jgi:2-polyprenyl-3-methyl-5-hydroxy-6-metoxy-1,4-benzoquinol methylase
MSQVETYEKETIMVKSPVTGRICNHPVRWYKTDEIVKKYRDGYGYDVSDFFKGVKKIGLYVCPDTGYQFFFPKIEGNGDFYSCMQKKPTYYMDWKWEHEEAMQYIVKGDAVLEIGSGAGGFLSGLAKQRQVHACGLELNPSAIESASARGVRVINESLTQHASDHIGVYDVVCTFQVLEHVYDISGFINAAVACLKQGGRFIVSVPDNDSFVGTLDPISDCPPHHVGRYTMASLEKIGEFFGLKKWSAIKEPLQKYHYSAVELVLIRRLFGENRYIRKLCTTLGGYWLVRKMVVTCGAWMNGHTLFMVFVKN